MRILLTNDDGILADGIFALYQQIKSLGDVLVVAPAVEQSAAGHAITLYHPIRVKKVSREKGFWGYAVNGTPADCVKFAIKMLMPKPPDIVVSGINAGPNVGLAVLYSGTVSAAMEGTILGFPSIAISLGTKIDPDFRYAAKFAKKLIRTVHKHGLPQGTLLNVNVPAVSAEAIRGVRITRHGSSRIVENFDKRIDPQRRDYFWLSGELVAVEDGHDVDSTALTNREISVTPIHYDLTHHKFIGALEKWKIEK